MALYSYDFNGVHAYYKELCIFDNPDFNSLKQLWYTLFTSLYLDNTVRRSLVASFCNLEILKVVHPFKEFRHTKNHDTKFNPE